MNKPLTGQTKGKRVRASEPAIRAALTALRNAGLPVGKVCINGGQVEIHCLAIEATADEHNDEGLEKW